MGAHSARGVGRGVPAAVPSAPKAMPLWGGGGCEWVLHGIFTLHQTLQMVCDSLFKMAFLRIVAIFLGIQYMDMVRAGGWGGLM